MFGTLIGQEIGTGRKTHSEVRAVPLIILEIQGKERLCVPQQMVTYSMCCYS